MDSSSSLSSRRNFSTPTLDSPVSGFPSFSVREDGLEGVPPTITSVVSEELLRSSSQGSLASIASDDSERYSNSGGPLEPHVVEAIPVTVERERVDNDQLSRFGDAPSRCASLKGCFTPKRVVIGIALALGVLGVTALGVGLGIRGNHPKVGLGLLIGGGATVTAGLLEGAIGLGVIHYKKGSKKQRRRAPPPETNWAQITYPSHNSTWGETPSPTSSWVNINEGGGHSNVERGGIISQEMRDIALDPAHNKNLD